MIFIDTGAFLGRYLPDDQHHSAAVSSWEKIRQHQEKCFTSNFVLNEFFTLLARKTDYDYAAERAQNTLSSTTFAVLRPEHEDELQALEFFRKYADQKVSFTDCVSFVLMRRHKIKRAFSFDRHFRHAGFEIYP